MKRETEFVATVTDALQAIDPQVMLTDGIAAAFKAGVAELQGSGAATKIFGETCADRTATPIVFSTSGEEWLAHPELAEEVFGPPALLFALRTGMKCRRSQRASVVN